MRLLALTLCLVCGVVVLGQAEEPDTLGGAQIWAEFTQSLQSGPFPTERIRPYHEDLLQSMAGVLAMIREQADWEEWSTQPEVFHSGDQVHLLTTLTFNSLRAEYCFSFLVEDGDWYFQHLEGIAIRMDKLGSLPASEFPDLPEDTKSWMRAELAVSREVWLFTTLAAERGTEAALEWFRDGDGYALAARSWVPFVEPHRAFVLYLCWEQSNLRGNEVTLEQLDDEDALVRIRPMFFLLYDRTAHLKQQISYEQYQRLFEFRWHDRASSAGWQIEFEYHDEECVFHLHRG